MSQRTRVGVLRGGPSSEYEVSLKTGSAVLANLDQNRYESKDIFIDRSGMWHLYGRPIAPERAINQLDVVFLALHGTFGEDGQVQRLLERHGVPFTGSRSLASALAMNKVMAKHVLRDTGVRMAAHRTVSYDDLTPELTFELFRTFPQPCVIKPLASGSSVGVGIAMNFDEFVTALERGFMESDTIMLEEFISGIEATVGILEKFRNESHYALPDIEIRPHKGRSFFDYEAKYQGASEEICPGRFDAATKQELARVARLVHQTLNLSHYSRSDFMVGKRGIYFLEVNTLPGLTEASLLPQAVHAVGVPFPAFLDHLVGLARIHR